MATATFNGDFRFGSNGTPSSLVNNSSKTKSVDFPREQDTLDATALGSTSRNYVVGLSSATLKAEMFWDSTLDAQIQGLIGYATAVTFNYGPDGSTTGYPKYSGSAFLKSAGTPIEVGGVKMVTVDFQITGDVTRGTY